MKRTGYYSKISKIIENKQMFSELLIELKEQRGPQKNEDYTDEEIKSMVERYKKMLKYLKSQTEYHQQSLAHVYSIDRFEYGAL